MIFGSMTSESKSIECSNDSKADDAVERAHPNENNILIMTLFRATGIKIAIPFTEIT